MNTVTGTVALNMIYEGQIPCTQAHLENNADQNFINHMKRFCLHVCLFFHWSQHCLKIFCFVIFYLENSAKKVHKLIGLNLCFYDSIETQN